MVVFNSIGVARVMDGRFRDSKNRDLKKIKKSLDFFRKKVIIYFPE